MYENVPAKILVSPGGSSIKSNISSKISTNTSKSNLSMNMN